MKIFYIFLIFIGPVFMNKSIKTEINYNPKQLHKEIISITDCSIYSKEEIPSNLLIQKDLTINGKFFSILCDNEKLFAYIGRVKSCRANGCAIIEKHDDSEDYEFFDYFILFDRAKQIKLVKVFNYEATHGHEITAKGWLKQFIGYDGKKSLEVGKNVDAISGATISVYGIVSDVQEKTIILQNAIFTN